MQRKFFTNLALLLILNLAIKPLWILGVDKEVQNLLGDQTFGVYSALLNLSFLMNALLDLGLTNFNNRNIAQHSHLLTKHFSNIVGLKMLLGLFYAAITMLAGLILGYGQYELYLLLILCVNQFLISFIQYLRSNISGLHLFRTDSIVSVLDRLFMIGVCGTLIWAVTFSGFSVELFIYTQTAGYFLTALIAFIIVQNQAGHFQMRWNRLFFLTILKKSIPYAVLIILMMIYNRADMVIIERILPDGDVQSGIYQKAFRLLDAVNMIGVIFAGLLLPLFSRMLKKKEEINKLLNFSLALILSGAMITAVSSWTYSGELMEVLYHTHFEESASVFGPLMFSFIGIAITHIFGTLLTANGSLRTLNLIALGGAVLSLGVNFVLIPSLKAEGAAITANIVQFSVAIALVIATGRIFGFNVKYYLILRIVIFFAGLVIIALASRYLPFGWTMGYFTVWGAGVLWAFITRMLSARSIYYIVKNGE